MTETEFLDRMHRMWTDVESRVDQWVDQHDVDIETTRQGPVLELEFESGRKIIINAQTPMQQIWLASPRGAFHFEWTASEWRDTRSGHPFWNVLAQQASQEAGQPLS